MQIVLNFERGTTPSAIATELRFYAGLFEGQPPKTAASSKNTAAESDVDPKAPSAKKTISVTKRQAAPVEESAQDEAEDSMTEAFGEPAHKRKAVTADEVKAVCWRVSKALQAVEGASKGEGVAQVKAMLKKKFKNESVDGISPERYHAVIEALEDMEAAV